LLPLIFFIDCSGSGTPIARVRTFDIELKGVT
jgi:hypothetical protein